MTGKFHTQHARFGRGRRWASGGLLLSLALAVTGARPVLSAPGWDYGKRGLEWSNTETGSYLWLGLRGQGRYTSIEQPLHIPDDFNTTTKSDWSVNRARYKIGLGFQNELTAYHEYDMKDARLLDLRATWTPAPVFNFRIGQWKSEYNRERIDSSGKQQFVERSIATYWFTLDRQWGAMASGRLWQGQARDSSWWAGVLGGAGRSTSDDGGRPLVMGRWQWNYTGNVLPFSQSALQHYETPHASLSFSVAANDSRYTRFSSAGGEQLPGYEEGRDNQYRVQQAMQEWAWQRGGLSFQQELHFKSVEDRVNGGTRKLYGGYAQVGWFPSDRWPRVPENLEFAVRGAYVNPDSPEDLENVEISLAANWFINGHRNKFTLDTSYLSVDEDGRRESDYLLRLQWDLSI